MRTVAASVARRFCRNLFLLRQCVHLRPLAALRVPAGESTPDAPRAPAQRPRRGLPTRYTVVKVRNVMLTSSRKLKGSTALSFNISMRMFAPTGSHTAQHKL